MQPKKYLDYDGLSYFIQKMKDQFNNMEFGEYLKYTSGSNNVNTLENIPITKRLVCAEISTNNQLSISGIPPSGRYLHILVKNTSANQITVSLPTTMPYLSNSDVMVVPANTTGEINALSDGINIYLKSS